MLKTIYFENSCLSKRNSVKRQGRRFNHIQCFADF